MAMNDPDAPRWITDIVSQRNGHGLQYITSKNLTRAKLDPQQNRILVPKQPVAAKILPMITEEENDRVLNKGLEIRVFARNQFRCENVKLTRWGSTGSYVVNGPGLNVFRAVSEVNERDKVEMRGFKDRLDEKLCFAIGKK